MAESPNPWSLFLLACLQKKRMDNLYMGTVPAAVTARRRAKNKRSRKARAITRGDSRG